jgi:cytochrome c-type biogenesis protein CcmH
MNRIARTLLLLLALSPGARGNDIDARAETLFARFMPPCCFTGILKDHQSPAADEMKGEIRAFLEEGKSEREIVDHYVGIYGERILSEPPEEGFNRLAILAPLLALGTGLLVVGGILRRRGRLAGGGVPASTPPRPEPDLEERIEREIRDGM